MKPEETPPMENNESQGVVKRVKKKTAKTETRFDRKWNWVKNHKILHWIPLAAIVCSTVWALLPKPVKDAVNNTITHIGKPEPNSEADKLLTIIRKYYADMADGSFKASNYFAPHVDKFIRAPNTTPAEIDAYYIASHQDFLSPSSRILDSTFSFAKDPDGHQTVQCWLEFSCFRKAKNKYQSCLTHVEFVFDKHNKMLSSIELQNKNLRYFDKAVQLSGSVGKLPAVFTLTFDYTNKKIEGSYYYPTRKGIEYRLSGIIGLNRIELIEYTGGKKTATCALKVIDSSHFTGTMFNTNGRELKMDMSAEEAVFF